MKTIYQEQNYYDYSLMRYRDFIDSMKYVDYGIKKERAKYKWYEIEWLWEIPYYHILSSSLGNGRQAKTILANKIPLIKATIRSLGWIITVIIAWCIECILNHFFNFMT